MATSKMKRRGRPQVCADLGEEHLAMLDSLIDLYQRYKIQLDDWKYRRITRSVMLRAAVAELFKRAGNGTVGPEVLKLAHHSEVRREG